MKYEELELIGFKRMAASNISYFNIKPVEAVQLVIGSNGSGKSSLLGEMSPLPANASDFEKEGSKRIVITHHGVRYELRSEFSPSAKHYFKQEDEELNPGGTASVFKELVWQKFSYTQDIHKLNTGKLRFTNMSPLQRREWFTKMAETDYDYAIALYKRIKERLRDVSGALKLARVRLVTETAKTMSNAERESLEREVDELHRIIQAMTENRTPIEHDVGNLQTAFDKLMTDGAQLCKLVIRKKIRLKTEEFRSEQEVVEEISALKNKQEVNKQLNDALYEEFTALNQILEQVKLAGVQDTEEIKKKIQICLEEQVRLRSTRNICKGPIEGPEEVYKAFETVRPAIEAIFLELPENADRRFVPLKAEENKTHLLQVTDRVNFLEAEIRELKSRKAHQEAHKQNGETECPKCNHKWFLGFSDASYQKICHDLANMTETLPVLQESLAIAKKFDEEVNAYLTLYRSFFTYVKNWPILQPLWDHLVEKKYILDNPAKAVQECNLFLTDIRSEMQCAVHQKTIDRLSEQIHVRETLGVQDVEKLTKRQEELEKQIQERSLAIHNLQYRIGYLENMAADIRHITKLSFEVATILGDATKNVNNQVETNKRLALHRAIREVQSALARKEDILNAAMLQKGIIEDLENQIKQHELDVESLKMLEDELSPTDGLIAEGLMGFIRLFVGKMNKFIKKVWSYPLIILPCKNGEEGSVELDYKFPVIVKDKDNVIPDVSDGSDGMLQVINLAFVVTGLKYLGLEESPLFLDEWGATFDAVHRDAAALIVKSLTEEHPFTQLFTINHYAASYGSLLNAELCVLNKDNVVIPPGMAYNEHVRMH